MAIKWTQCLTARVNLKKNEKEAMSKIESKGLLENRHLSVNFEVVAKEKVEEETHQVQGTDPG